jgi:signal peptidase II
VNNYKRFFSISATIVLILFFDQLSKIFIINYFQTNNSIIYLTSFLNFELIWNEGIAFGLLSFENSKVYNFISIIILLVVLIILFVIYKTKNLTVYFYSMIVGGALGNLLDRVRYSSVPDFIDFHIGEFHWFIFNIADIFISIGVICLIMVEIFGQKDLKNEN